ncbi:hypothetical protein [Natrinema thermotolerans]
MRRRTYVTSIGAGIASLAGVTAFAKPEFVLGLGKGKRGAGEETSITKTITDNDISYREESNEVRYPTVYSGGEPQEFATESFKRWAKRKAASVGSTVILPTIEDRLDTSLHGVGKSVGGRFFQTVIFVNYITPRDPESDHPDLSFEEVVKVAPQEVHATVVLAGKKYTRSVPVIVRKSNDGVPN